MGQVKFTKNGENNSAQIGEIKSIRFGENNIDIITNGQRSLGIIYCVSLIVIYLLFLKLLFHLYFEIPVNSINNI